MGDFFNNYKTHGKFTKPELVSILITGAAIGLITGFNDGRINAPIDAYYLTYFLAAMIFSIIGIFFHEIVHRIAAIKRGYKAVFYHSPIGLFVSCVLALATLGRIWIFTPGYTKIEHLEFQRLGRFRYQMNRKEIAWVSIAGALGSVFLAIFLKSINIFDSPFLLLAAKINIAIAAYSLLPIPQEDGIYAFSSRRWIYYFGVCSVIGGGLAVFYLTNIFLMLMVAGLIGLFGAILLHYSIDEAKR